MKTNTKLEITFSKRLKQLRRSQDITHVDLANMVGISKSAVSSYENRLVFPTFPNFMKICNALGTSPNYLLGYE